MFDIKIPLISCFKGMVKFIQRFNYFKTTVTYIDQIAIAFVIIHFTLNNYGH